MTEVSQLHAPSLALTRARLRAGIITMADRVHAPGDDVARREGWTVRRVGLTARSYRSPLFDARGGAR